MDGFERSLQVFYPDFVLAKSSSPRFSIVIPCFNQGRFLVDCLESLAIQDLLPFEVIVVNDGSTDDGTKAMMGRLPSYHYPFPVRCLNRPNGGLASARNYGIKHSTGDVIVPLDADDKLYPRALSEYAKAFAQYPEIDVISPDAVLFGNQDDTWCLPFFNAWRLTEMNIMACSSAIRRRVFAAGYWYTDEWGRGYEDWEFWIRTCALGPFKARALHLPVFGYRKWGFSMYSAVNHDDLVCQMRAFHTAAGIWSTDIDRKLRKTCAPTHRLVADNADAWAHVDDLATVAPSEVESFLETDTISRFLWVGVLPPEAAGPLQLIVNEVARRFPSLAYVFTSSVADDAYLVVIDRLTALNKGMGHLVSLETLHLVTTVHTEGKRGPRVKAITEGGTLGPSATALLASVVKAGDATLLPSALHHSSRAKSDVWYYFGREPQVPRPVASPQAGRTLAIAMPSLTCGGSEFAVRLFLEEGTVRRHFDKIVILTFFDHEHDTHACFEPLTDAIYHLGNLGLSDERKLALAQQLLEASKASDLLVANSEHGYHLLPRLRKARMPLKVHGQVHSIGIDPHTGLQSLGPPRLLASQYAALIDRVASISDALTAHMIDRLYFPSDKIRTVRLGIDQTRFRPRSPQERVDRADAKQVVWCGRLSDEKDPLLALKVAQRFHESFPNVRMMFVGDGPLAAEFGERLRNYKESGALVTWIPYTDRVEDVLRTSDCLFMTSTYEGIPIVVMEAFACGLPVVMCLTNTAAGELANSGCFFAVADRLDLDAYCRRIQEALASTPGIAADQVLAHHRYARELIDWLFSAEVQARTDHLHSVFGVTAAA
jgi:glycosyltransferase involved in cell wall biosynthesis